MNYALLRVTIQYILLLRVLYIELISISGLYTFTEQHAQHIPT